MTIEFRPESGNNVEYPDGTKVLGVKILTQDLPKNIDTGTFSGISVYPKGPLAIRVDLNVSPQSISLLHPGQNEENPQKVSHFQFKEQGLRVIMPNTDGMDLKGKIFPVDPKTKK